ncbi:Uncharacterised protein [Serratia marcescens]|nr:Uncharacterised protein [Serratia marcescens]
MYERRGQWGSSVYYTPKKRPVSPCEQFPHTGATSPPLRYHKKRRDDPYRNDFGCFCRQIEASCRVWSCPSLFGASSSFAGFIGSTRRCGRWVIHGTNHVGDSKPGPPFWCPTAVGRPRAASDELRHQGAALRAHVIEILRESWMEIANGPQGPAVARFPETGRVPLNRGLGTVKQGVGCR